MKLARFLQAKNESKMNGKKNKVRKMSGCGGELGVHRQNRFFAPRRFSFSTSLGIHKSLFSLGIIGLAMQDPHLRALKSPELLQMMWRNDC
jgi:hypothetical protein